MGDARTMMCAYRYYSKYNSTGKFLGMRIKIYMYLLNVLHTLSLTLLGVSTNFVRNFEKTPVLEGPEI